MAKTTKTITVRASIEAIDCFVSRCRAQGQAPSRVLRDVIEAQAADVRQEPKAEAIKPRQRKPVQPAEKPIGFDAATGEPIFKRGVGPQREKKK